MSLLEVKNLQVIDTLNNKEILKGVNFKHCRNINSQEDESRRIQLKQNKHTNNGQKCTALI